MKVAHVQASNVVTSFTSSQVSVTILEKVLRSDLLENLHEKEEGRVEKIFKEWYRRIPPHQYEEVKKHLQECWI